MKFQLINYQRSENENTHQYNNRINKAERKQRIIGIVIGIIGLSLSIIYFKLKN